MGGGLPVVEVRTVFDDHLLEGLVQVVVELLVTHCAGHLLPLFVLQEVAGVSVVQPAGGGVPPKPLEHVILPATPRYGFRVQVDDVTGAKRLCQLSLVRSYSRECYIHAKASRTCPE
eukprot:1178490-Prorocentrum_minimum.AAC.4